MILSLNLLLAQHAHALNPNINVLFEHYGDPSSVIIYMLVWNSLLFVCMSTYF
jgi:hypothetical protein